MRWRGLPRRNERAHPALRITAKPRLSAKSPVMTVVISPDRGGDRRKCRQIGRQHWVREKNGNNRQQIFGIHLVFLVFGRGDYAWRSCGSVAHPAGLTLRAGCSASSNRSSGGFRAQNWGRKSPRISRSISFEKGAEL